MMWGRIDFGQEPLRDMSEFELWKATGRRALRVARQRLPARQRALGMVLGLGALVGTALLAPQHPMTVRHGPGAALVRTERAARPFGRPPRAWGREGREGREGHGVPPGSPRRRPRPRPRAQSHPQPQPRSPRPRRPPHRPQVPARGPPASSRRGARPPHL